MTKVISKKKLKSLSEIEISWNKNRHVRNERHMKLISPPELHHSIEVAGIDSFDKISFVTPDRVWVSDRHNLILTNKSGDTLHKLGLKDLFGSFVDFCPANNGNELVYIDMNSDIKKLSTHMKTSTTFINATNYDWDPLCLFWSASTGDLLVGWSSYVDDTDDDQLTSYNQTGQLTQTMHNDEIQNICRVGEYIIETINRDTIVTDVDDLVVSSLLSKMSPSFSLWASYTKNKLKTYPLRSDRTTDSNNN